ncbi:MAG: tetratricopeptide repeat protein [Myxococcales bacterium]|nr:tetratricopeptide repeat protein [Myxococcales bacterium]
MHKNRRLVTLFLALVLAACSSTPEKPDQKLDTTAGGAGAAAAPTAAKPPDVSAEARAAYAEAVTAYQDQKKSGAIDYRGLVEKFERVLSIDAKMAEAHYNLGCIWEALHDDAKAEGHYKKALEIFPKLTLAAANWGALLARQGKLDEALSVYRRALSEDAKNSAVLLNMAAILQTQKQFDEALKLAAQVLVRDPTNIGAYRLMASLYLDKGDLDMAKLICLRGLALREKDPRLLNTMGLILLQNKKASEALAQFRMALQQAPDMIPTLFNVAKIALDYRDFKVAREQFKKILEYEPDNKKAEIGLGLAMRGNGDHEAARQHFLQLAEKYKDDALPRFWLCQMALRNFNDNAATQKECKGYLEVCRSTGRCPANQVEIAKKTIDEAMQNIQMDEKIKEEEKRMQAEQAALEKRLADLEKARTEAIEKEWAKAEEASGPLPPKKATGAEVPFVVIPLAVDPDKDYRIRLMGALFSDVAKVEIGTLKVKHVLLDETTMEFDITRGREPGPWDVMITWKDKNKDPLLFQGGLWVEYPPCQPREKHKARIDQERAEILDKAWKAAEEAGEPLPATKYAAADIPFVPVPLAFVSDKPVRVRLKGALFRCVARVDFGKFKVKHLIPDENTLEFDVPKGTKPGNYDIKVSYVDKNLKPLVFPNGLVIVEKGKTPPPEQKPAPAVGKEQAAPEAPKNPEKSPAPAPPSGGSEPSEPAEPAEPAAP